MLLAVARTILRDEAESWDIMQVTQEIALRRRASLRDPAALRAWLLRIEVREALRLRRRLRRLVSLESAIRELPVVSGPGTEPVAVHSALGHLPGRMRNAVVLHHMVGLSISDTAAICIAVGKQSFELCPKLT